MKYAIKYYRNGTIDSEEILNKADEIIIKYTHKTAEIIDFVQKWREDQRIVVNLTEMNEIAIDEMIEIFVAARSKHNNLALLLPYPSIGIDDRCKENDLPFFFGLPIDRQDMLVWAIEDGVSDVYIVNEFGFSLKDISALCKSAGVNIRVYPNVAQSSMALRCDNQFASFFIRPEDIELYSDYVDVCEFYGPLDKQKVLHDIYTSEHWSGNLKDIILDLEYDIDSRTITPYFGKSRLGCNKMCTYGKCKICYNTQSLAKVLEEKGLGLRKERTYEHKINESTLSNDATSVAERVDGVFKEEV